MSQDRKARKIAVLAMFLGVLSIIGVMVAIGVGSRPSGGSSGGADPPTNNAQCSAGFFATQVQETDNVTMVISCSQVGWTQLTGYPSGCAANQFVTAIGASLTCSEEPASSVKCVSAGQFANNVTESSGGILTLVCDYPDWTKLVNFPSGCSAGNFVTGVGVTLTCSTVAWSQLTSFPSGCAANQFVTAVGVTLTCSALPQNTCDGTLWAYDRCETASTSCTISAGSTGCTKVVSFSPSFTNTPVPIVTVSQAWPTSQIFTGEGDFVGNSVVTWTNLPAASTEFLGTTVNRLNYSNTFKALLSFHFEVIVAGSAGSALGVEYSTNGGSTFSTACSPVTFGTSTGYFAETSSCGGVTASTANGMLFRVVGSGGNGVADPQFAHVYLEFSANINTGGADARSVGTTGMIVDISIPGIVTASTTINFVWKAVSETG